MIVNKVTTGCVIQTYDTKLNRCIAQEFIAADEVQWEDVNGEIIDDTYDEDVPVEKLPYQSFDMVQPVKSAYPLFKEE